MDPSGTSTTLASDVTREACLFIFAACRDREIELLGHVTGGLAM